MEKEAFLPSLYSRHHNINLYKDLSTIQQKIIEKQCITYVLIDSSSTDYSDNCKIILKQNNKFKLYSISFDDSNGYHLNGLWYSSIKCLDDCSYGNVIDCNTIISKIEDHLLLLPLDYFEDSLLRYTCITKKVENKNLYGKIYTS